MMIHQYYKAITLGRFSLVAINRIARNNATLFGVLFPREARPGRPSGSPRTDERHVWKDWDVTGADMHKVMSAY